MKNKNGALQEDHAGIARVDTSAGSEKQEPNATNDVNQTDRKEGSMENGKLGGNFEETGSGEKDYSERSE